MLGLEKNQVDKSKDALRSVNELGHDARLRADLRSAIGHGAAIARIVRKASEAGEFGGLGAAGVRPEATREFAGASRRHREMSRAHEPTSATFRKIMLALGGAGVIVAALPAARRCGGPPTRAGGGPPHQLRGSRNRSKSMCRSARLTTSGRSSRSSHGSWRGSKSTAARRHAAALGGERRRQTAGVGCKDHRADP